MFLSGFKLNDRIMVAELDGVIQQIIEYLLDLVHIGHHIHFIACQHQFDGDGFGTAGALKRGRHGADRRVNVEISFVQHDSLCIQIIKRQKTVGKFCQPLGFIQKDGQIFFMHFERNSTVDHGFQIALDGSQRRTEIVGNIGHKFLLVVFRACNLVRHII